MANSRWRGVTRNTSYKRCQSCNLETQFLFKGYALRLFRLDPILTGSDMLLGTVVRLVEAMVCNRCRDENTPTAVAKPIPIKPTTEAVWEDPICNHCECSPRYTCCHCGGGQE